eukprot:m.119910 g.119910  ORF g.119910 m.119910 type:complete len:208 (-) comp15602_c0_seq4:707-1330(-)
MYIDLFRFICLCNAVEQLLAKGLIVEFAISVKETLRRMSSPVLCSPHGLSRDNIALEARGSLIGDEFEALRDFMTTSKGTIRKEMGERIKAMVLLLMGALATRRNQQYGWHRKGIEQLSRKLDAIYLLFKAMFNTPVEMIDGQPQTKKSCRTLSTRKILSVAKDLNINRDARKLLGVLAMEACPCGIPRLGFYARSCPFGCYVGRSS